MAKLRFGTLDFHDRVGEARENPREQQGSHGVTRACHRAGPAANTTAPAGSGRATTDGGAAPPTGVAHSSPEARRSEKEKVGYVCIQRAALLVWRRHQGRERCEERGGQHAFVRRSRPWLEKAEDAGESYPLLQARDPKDPIVDPKTGGLLWFS